jgi:hypothetical protein
LFFSGSSPGASGVCKDMVLSTLGGTYHSPSGLGGKMSFRGYEAVTNGAGREDASQNPLVPIFCSC